MDVRTYRAATMQEALQMVRHDLGSNAAVLQTREVRRGGILRWLSSQRGIEVLASNDVQVPSRLPPRAEAVPPAANRIRSTQTESKPASQVVVRSSDTHVHDEIKTQISELQAMVERLYRNGGGSGSPDLQPSLFQVYTDLIEAEIGEQTARALVERLREGTLPQEQTDPAQLTARLCRLLEADIQCSGPISLQHGGRVVALVGPTGVGKTTTIAKLAANFRLREKRKVALITVDTYRVAAVEQLRTYADIIDLPMEVVSTPREMRAAVERLAGHDLILIDTAGRSPGDEVKIQELRALLGEARADEVHLVVSSVASAATLRRTAERFAPAGVTAILFTKLDEATAAGNLLEVLQHSGLPVSYLTVGQNVPDDIRPAEVKRLIRQMIGVEPLTSR